jgi:hypothetical protein
LDCGLLSEFEVLGQDAAGKVLCHERFVDLLGVPRDQRVLSVTSQDEDLVRFHALDRITQDVVHIGPLDLPLEHGGVEEVFLGRLHFSWESLGLLLCLETPGHDLFQKICGLPKVRFRHTVDDCELIDLLVILKQADSSLDETRVEVVEINFGTHLPTTLQVETLSDLSCRGC